MYKVYTYIKHYIIGNVSRLEIGSKADGVSETISCLKGKILGMVFQLFQLLRFLRNCYDCSIVPVVPVVPVVRRGLCLIQ